MNGNLVKAAQAIVAQFVELESMRGEPFPEYFRPAISPAKRIANTVGVEVLMLRALAAALNETQACQDESSAVVSGRANTMELPL